MKYSRLTSLILIAGLASARAAVAQVSQQATASNAGNDHLLWLFATTLAIVVGLAIWQRFRVREAKRRGDHSAITTAEPGVEKSKRR